MTANVVFWPDPTPRKIDSLLRKRCADGSISHTHGGERVYLP